MQGQHTGANLASVALNILKEYEITEKLFCVTADNASNNGTLSRTLEEEINTFKADQNMLGCVGHVVNLGAKAALKAIDQKKASPAAVPTVSVARPKSSRCRSTEIISDDEVDDVMNL